jgi:RNA polymerase sigma-70 factor (ECF subfamily)
MDGAAPPAAGSPGPADADVVARAREGDHAAFRVLVERYQGRAYRLALRVLRDEEQAQDVVQDAFLKAYGSLARFEGRSGFYTWLYRIVMNLCLDRKRRDRSDREVEWSEDLSAAAVGHPEASVADPGHSGPHAEAERSELRAVVARAIEALPEDARRTIQLREIDGLSYKEIAETLGIPKGTVMSRLHYARRRLQESLRAAGMDPFAEGRRAEGSA